MADTEMGLRSWHTSCWQARSTPALSWILQGSEAGIVAAGVAVSTVAAFGAYDRSRFTYWPCVIAASLSLVRADAVVPSTAICLWLMWAQPQYRWRYALAFCLIVGGAIAVQTGVRQWLFGSPLPNTYYLKMTGFPVTTRLLRGLVVYGDFLAATWVVLPLALIARRSLAKEAAVVGLFALTSVYSIYCGGDAWEWWGGSNRYLTPALLMLLVLPARGIGRLSRTRSCRPRRSNRCRCAGCHSTEQIW